MTNDVQTFFGASKVSVTKGVKLAQQMKESADKNPRGGIDGSEYGSFSGKSGRWSLGEAKKDADAEELWICNIFSFEDGWICWKSSQPVDKRMANIFKDPPIETPDMEQHGPFASGTSDGWVQAKAMIFRSVETGQQIYYSTSSVSGLDAVAKLQTQITDQDEADQPRWPVFTLASEKFGKHNNYKPIFELAGWLDDDQIMEAGEDNADIEAMMEANRGEDEEVRLPSPATAKAPAVPTAGTRRNRL